MNEAKAKLPAPDPNSAKYKLGKVTENHFKRAFEAKARGEKIGWCASNFPQEIFETLGVPVVYPENQAAIIAARGGGERMCTKAESMGYSNDLCAYARISLAYTADPAAPEQELPMPDFMLCCNNICNCLIKWFENIAWELNIPMILIDIPMNPYNELTEEEVAYVSAQFWEAISRLEAITGKTWDERRFQEVCAISNRCSKAWLEVCAYTKYEPSPYNGFDLMNHMAAIVTSRGTVEAAEAFEALIEEHRRAVETGSSTYRGEQKHRIIFDGIACWPHLRPVSRGLSNRGINMVATAYADGFGYHYENFEGLIRAYCTGINSLNLENGVELRKKMAQRTHCDGMLIHNNRSCKQWAGYLSELGRRVGAACNIPVVTFDGDQADPRNFSSAQYDTRVQGLTEMMELRKEPGSL